jgi:uncharacterized RDD family membrane protein YckC
VRLQLDSLPDGQVPVDMSSAVGQSDVRTTVVKIISLVLVFLGIITMVSVPIGIGLGIFFLTRNEEPAVTGTPVEVKSVPSVKYAGFWLRLVAYLIDVIVVYIGTQIIVSVLLLGMAADKATVVSSLVGIVATWLYFALMESSVPQATLGKMCLSLKTTDVHGERLTFARATGRYFAKYLSSLTLGVGYIMAGFTQKKQALHDIIAGTLVVRK